MSSYVYNIICIYILFDIHTCRDSVPMCVASQISNPNCNLKGGGSRIVRRSYFGCSLVSTKLVGKFSFISPNGTVFHHGFTTFPHWETRRQISKKTKPLPAEINQKFMELMQSAGKPLAKFLPTYVFSWFTVQFKSSYGWFPHFPDRPLSNKTRNSP